MFNPKTLDEKIILTGADLQNLEVFARRELGAAIVCQVLAGVCTAIICALFGSFSSAGWCLLGAGAYLLPNGLFALRLWLATYRPSGASPELFFLGEFLKVSLVLGLLWLIADFGGDRVEWLAVLAGLIASLKGYVLLLITKGFWAK